MPNESELKPCPFCGRKDIQYRYTGSSCHEFVCATATCPDVQVFYKNIERAYEAYNTRPAPAQSEEIIEAAKSLIENLEYGDFLSTTRIDALKAAIANASQSGEENTDG